MLKTILVSEDPLSIYPPNSRAVKSALSKVTKSLKPEDILISEEKFQTIKYIETVEKYNDLFHKLKKVYQVLNSLGQKRNRITHFGIDESDDLGELTIQILNTFDVIYNYLYPQLIDLDDISVYFKSDDLFVDTAHRIDINFSVCNFESNEYVLDINQGSECLNSIFSCYSPFFNVTAFCGEYSEIYFIVVHDDHELYIYKDDNAAWPQHDEPETDYQRAKDYGNGFCDLSKRNLLIAFENVLQRI